MEGIVIFMENKKIEILLISISTLIYILCGALKTYIHMDEAYSLGLASYDKVEIQNNTDFYDTWHDKSYYEDYLAVNEDEKFDFKQVYINQKNDVHPPLYYLLLRIAMGFSIGHFSKWPGIILNIIIFAFINIFTYLILQKLLKDQKYVKEKSILLSFISSITMASLTNVIYIRMYALSTLNILITTYLHIKLFENKKPTIKLLIFIGLSALGRIFNTLLLFILFIYVIYCFCNNVFEEKRI